MCLPHGDVRDLPKGATPIDFAYSIHTDIGHRFRGAKINGRIVPLDHPLNNGDVVEILVNNKEAPNLYWLSSVVTVHAKSSIKLWFKRHDHDKLIALGKELLNKHLLRHGLIELDTNLSVLADVYDRKLALRDRERVLEEIGKGILSPKNIVRRIVEKSDPKAFKSNLKLKKNKSDKNIEKPDDVGILVRGDSNYETKLALCCKPKISDKIIGYITHTQVISIHSKNCYFIRNLSERDLNHKLVEVSWDLPDQDLYSVSLELVYKRNFDVLPDLLEVISKYPVELKKFEKTVSGEGFGISRSFINCCSKIRSNSNCI